MESRKTVIALLLTACMAALSACGQDTSAAGALKRGGFDTAKLSGMKVELRFLDESKGSNYKYTDISADAELVQELCGCLDSCKPAQKPQENPFSPELRSDCEIVFTGGGDQSASFYFMSQGNLLIYPDRKTGKNGDTLTYRYYTPDQKLGELISSQRQLARLKQENAVTPFRNMEELKSSIDPDELSEEGAELDFEFFSGAAPANSGTACRIYTTAEFPAVPADSYLITAYGKTKSGQQEKLSIDGMEANTNYTKIIVSEPDAALESVDTGEEAPEAFAAVVKKDAIDPKKWIVFVDDANNILDVILPEDITVSPDATVIPEATPEPSASPTPAPTPTPEASASPSGASVAPSATASETPSAAGTAGSGSN